MTDLIATIQAIIRHELAGFRAPELGIVTEVFPRDSESGDGNHQVNVRLQQSGAELQRAPVAVGRRGLSALPDVDELVVVAFLGGELNAPVVLGSVYHEGSHPPVAAGQEVVYQPPHDEDSAVRRLHLELPGGTLLTLDDDATVLSAGGTEVRVAHDGDVTVHAAGTVSLSADGDIHLSAGGDLKLEAQGSATIEGKVEAAVEGGASATVKGPMLSLAGNTQFSPS